MAGENGWRDTTIGDVSLGIFDGPHATPTKTQEGPIFLGISSLVNGRLDLSDTAHLSEEDFVKWTRRVTPQEDDVVFSYETRLGEAARIPTGLRCCLGRRMALIRPNPEKIDSRFLLYFYLSPPFQDVIRARTVHGSTVDRIPLLELPKFPIRIPLLCEQKAIASILGALDAKIELNRRMNETLESLARALFKSWFVDFDPVRAKMDGREPPGMDPGIAELFSDSFEHQNGDLIPSGWELLPLHRIAELQSGGTPKKNNAAFWDGTIPWISPKVMMAIHAYDSNERVTPDAIGNGTRLVPEGSVLVMVRGMGLHQGIRVSQVRRDVTFNQDVKALVPRAVDGTFLLFALLDASQRLFPKVQASGHGTGVLPTEFLKGLDFAVPPEDTRNKLIEPLTKLNSRIALNSRESETLTALRDTLLPRLLSGELRVPTAEKITGKVV